MLERCLHCLGCLFFMRRSRCACRPCPPPPSPSGCAHPPATCRPPRRHLHLQRAHKGAARGPAQRANPGQQRCLLGAVNAQHVRAASGRLSLQNLQHAPALGPGADADALEPSFRSAELAPAHPCAPVLRWWWWGVRPVSRQCFSALLKKGRQVGVCLCVRVCVLVGSGGCWVMGCVGGGDRGPCVATCASQCVAETLQPAWTKHRRPCPRFCLDFVATSFCASLYLQVSRTLPGRCAGVPLHAARRRGCLPPGEPAGPGWQESQGERHVQPSARCCCGSRCTECHIERWKAPGLRAGASPAGQVQDQAQEAWAAGPSNCKG